MSSSSSKGDASSRPVSGGLSVGANLNRPQILRATWHNYRQRGVYMITMCTEGRRPLLGRLEADAMGVGRVRLTPLGAAIEGILRELPAKYAELEVVSYVVMPDHIHVVVQVHQPMSRHLGEMVRQLKYESTVAYLRELDAAEGGLHRVEGGRQPKRERERGRMRSADGPQTTGLGVGMEGGQQTTGLSAGLEGGPQTTGLGAGMEGGLQTAGLGAGMEGIIWVKRLWQDNYHDRVLTEYGQLTKMLNYVADNPRRAWIKRQNRRFFYDKRMLDIPVAIELARALYRTARAMGELTALEQFLVVDRRVEGVRTSLRMRAMGNIFLMDEGLLLPLRVSRSITAGDYRQLRDEMMKRCDLEGAVVVTPCVSQGEQQMVHEVLEAGHHVVRVQHEGMSDLYTPPGRFVHPTADGRMLLLAPWPDLPLSTHPDKGRFELLNAVCRVLCGLMP